MCTDPTKSWKVSKSTWAPCPSTSTTPPSSQGKRKVSTGGSPSTTSVETSWRSDTVTDRSALSRSSVYSRAASLTFPFPLCMQKNLWNAYVHPEGAKTVGSMDLGGASTQIAFAVQDDLTGLDYMPVKLYGYPYNVYTHSFLCYGKNEADKRVLDKIVQVTQLFVYRYMCVCVFMSAAACSLFVCFLCSCLCTWDVCGYMCVFFCMHAHVKIPWSLLKNWLVNNANRQGETSAGCIMSLRILIGQ